jgi:DNA polymerase-1
MAVIQGRKKPIIQKGEGFVYNSATFAKEHKVSNFYEIEDPIELLKRVKPFDFKGRKIITFDTETHPHFRNSHLVPRSVVRRWVGSGKKATPQDYPFCMSICDGTNAYTIYDSIENNFAKFRQLAPLFEDPTIEKIAHNWKFDGHMFANAGMKIIGRVHDTVVLSKLANENRPSFQLRDLAARKKGGIVKFEFMVDTYKQTNKVVDYRQIPRELLTEYANADVWNAFIVFLDEYEKLEKDELVELYDKECELMIALYAMERHGMPTDSEYEAPLKKDLQVLVDTTEQAIYDEAGRMFNINSGKQLYDVLMGLGVNRGWITVTDKGNPCLDKDALNTLADRYNVSIVKKILEFRKNEKLLNTYAIGIYDQKDSSTKVHGNINQTEATTGRMSITKPALQTLPKKNKLIRRAFIPMEDYELYFMDLDQIEYRLFAHYAKIPSLLEAIKNGYDVHAATAAMIFHVDLEELLFWLNHEEPSKDDPDYQKIKDKMSSASDMRNKGKTINFALIYGVGIDHLSELLKCSTTEATELKAHYFSLLPEAKTFIATVHQVIKIRGFVKNYYSRRRRLDPNDCYKAPNALIQGCAADYIKNKLVDMFKYLMYYNLKSQLVLIVHDEVVVMSHKDEKEHLPKLRWLLSDFTSFRCPITAGLEKGEPSWGQKVSSTDILFTEPADKDFLTYNVYDGKVFDINKDCA